jgi:hypothetical protein
MCSDMSGLMLETVESLVADGTFIRSRHIDAVVILGEVLVLHGVLERGRHEADPIHVDRVRDCRSHGYG